MKKYLFAAILSVAVTQTHAQKKLLPVTQSILTGIYLPAGSTQDKRLLMEMSAKALLQIESKKAGTAMSTTEVLYLPNVDAAVFNADSLVSQLAALGWTVIPVATDNKFVWLQKDTRSILTYLSIGKKQIDLYFGEAATSPAIGGSTTISQDPQQQQQQE
jgi:hypothetical protein